MTVSGTPGTMINIRHAICCTWHGESKRRRSHRMTKPYQGSRQVTEYIEVTFDNAALIGSSKEDGNQETGTVSPEEEQYEACRFF